MRRQVLMEDYDLKRKDRARRSKIAFWASLGMFVATMLLPVFDTHGLGSYTESGGKVFGWYFLWFLVSPAAWSNLVCIGVLLVIPWLGLGFLWWRFIRRYPVPAEMAILLVFLLLVPFIWMILFGAGYFFGLGSLTWVFMVVLAGYAAWAVPFGRKKLSAPEESSDGGS